MRTEHDELLSAIGAALGEDGPYLEQLAQRDRSIHLGTGTSPPISASREVLGGAVGPDGCVGWIEQRSKPPHEGFVPVEIDVRVVVEGRLRVSTLATYNPFFGCTVHLAEWVDGGLTVLYSEKHHTLLARFGPPFEDQRLVVVQSEALRIGDWIVHLDRWRGVLHARSLTDLRPGITVLTERTLRDDVPQEQELRLDEAGALFVATLPEPEDVPGVDALDWVDVRSAQRRLATLRPVALPPDRPLPPPELLRARWIRLLGAVPMADRAVDALGADWLTPPEARRGYDFFARSSRAPGAGLPKEVRAALPKAEPTYGWPEHGSFDERLDRMFLAMVGRAVL